MCVSPAHSGHIVPLAANHINPEPQERDRLPVKLNPSGFPVAFCLVCVTGTALVAFFFLLGSFVFTQIIDCVPDPSLNCTYFFCSCTHGVALTEQMTERVAIQMVYSLSASPETTAQPGLIIL